MKKVLPGACRVADPSGTTYYPPAGSWRVLGAVEVLITGTTPAFAGAGSGTTSYYAIGGAMVAMRTAAMAALTYLHGDHPSASLRAGLGSVSLTTNASGQKVSEQPFGKLRAGCYKPGACPERQRGGEVRWSSGAGMPTDPSTDRITGPLRAGFTFTLRRRSGQRAGPANYVGSLMDYVARGYSPALGRFVSADTIVPGAGNSQAYNRYMYVLGNPLGRTDPSGHGACGGKSGDDFWQCRWFTAHGYTYYQGRGWSLGGDAQFEDPGIANDVAKEVGVEFAGSDLMGVTVRSWKQGERDLVLSGIVALMNKVGGAARFATLRGSAIVTLVRAFSFGILSPETPASTDPILRPNTIWFYDALFGSAWGSGRDEHVRATSVHEMTHIVAYRNLLPEDSNEVRRRIEDVVPHTGTPVSDYAAKNQFNLEYWADSVMAWMYRSDQTLTASLDRNAGSWITAVMLGYGWTP